MNGKKARALRKLSHNRKHYQALKRIVTGDRGQNPKFPKERTHKPKDTIAPTWPHTENQRAQRRPLIVLRPVRCLAIQSGKRSHNEWQRLFHRLPKWMIDNAAQA